MAMIVEHLSTEEIKYEILSRSGVPKGKTMDLGAQLRSILKTTAEPKWSLESAPFTAQCISYGEPHITQITMFRVVLLCVITAPASSQCLLSTTTPVSTHSLKNCSGSTNNNTTSCQPVTTISRSVSVIASQQPVFVFMTASTARFTRVDNICFTFFPLPDDPETFKAYRAIVYIDGSYTFDSFITKSFATGVNVWANPTRAYENYNLGYIGCGAYLRYSCRRYGDVAVASLISFGPGTGNGTGQKLTDECFQNAQKLARDNGLNLLDSPTGHYLPPYNLPSRCVYKQICLPENSSLSCQQGSSCEANDK